MINPKPLVVTSYHKETVLQPTAADSPNSLQNLLDTNQITSFSISPLGHYLLSDSTGMLYVGNRTNKVLEFQSVQVFNQTLLKVVSDSNVIICLGKDKEQAEVLIKLIDPKQKRLSVKNQHQTTLKELDCLLYSNQFLVLGEADTLFVYRMPKLRLLFSEHITYQQIPQKILKMDWNAVRRNILSRRDYSDDFVKNIISLNLILLSS